MHVFVGEKLPILFFMIPGMTTNNSNRWKLVWQLSFGFGGGST
jgi:hypothetical protein